MMPDLNGNTEGFFVFSDANKAKLFPLGSGNAGKNKIDGGESLPFSCSQSAFRSIVTAEVLPEFGRNFPGAGKNAGKKKIEVAQRAFRASLGRPVLRRTRTGVIRSATVFPGAGKKAGKEKFRIEARAWPGHTREAMTMRDSRRCKLSLVQGKVQGKRKLRPERKRFKLHRIAQRPAMGVIPCGNSIPGAGKNAGKEEFGTGRTVLPQVRRVPEVKQ
jgi:hypothetical protein